MELIHTNLQQQQQRQQQQQQQQQTTHIKSKLCNSDCYHV